MSRATHKPVTALGWVREDMDRMLVQLRSQFEHLASVPGIRSEAISDAVTRLEDLALTFHVIGLGGAALLADEMVSLGQALVKTDRQNRKTKGFEALMNAIVILPSYLDRLQAGHHDLPLLLMPAVNDMRAAVKKPALQEGALFAPSLDVELPEPVSDEDSTASEESLRDAAQRVKIQYEQTLLDWLNEQENLELLAPIQAICETLLRQLQRTDLVRTWWIAGEMLQGVMDKRIANDTHLRRLLARLHLNLKSLGEEGEAAVSAGSADTLSQSMLYSIALAKPGHRELDRVRKLFRLKDQMPDQQQLLQAQATVSGQDRGMYEALGSAISDELTLIKDLLDLELRSDQASSEHGQRICEALLRTQDTLKMLGMSDTSGELATLLSDFEQAAEVGTETREPALMGVAERLLGVESAVSAHIARLGQPAAEANQETLTGMPYYEFRGVLQQLLNQILHNIHQCQETLKKRLEGDHQADPEDVLMEAAGALELMGDKEATDLTQQLISRTRSLLGQVYSEDALPAQKLEHYTDAVAALELYLTARRDQQDARHFVGVLQDRLEQLATESEGEQGDAPGAGTSPAARDPASEMPAADTQAIEPGPDEPAAAGDDGISNDAVVLDDELLEVFIEEYEDVFDTLQEFLPQWVTSPANVNLLTEVRRCFHTLKGSGRMVGAFELGDFCWHIEDMLNALIESRVAAMSDAVLTVRLAQATLPALKQRLMNQSTGVTHEVIELLGQHAKQIAAGEAPDWAGLHARLPGFLAGMLPEQLATAPAPVEIAEASEEQELNTTMREELQLNLGKVESLLDSVSLDRNTLASEDQTRAAHSIAGVLALAPQGRDLEIAQALEAALETQRERLTPFNNEALWSLGSCFAFLQARLEQLEGDTDVEFPEEEETVLAQLAALKDWFEQAEPMERPVTEETPEPEPPQEQEAASESPAVADEQPDVTASTESDAAEASEPTDDDDEFHDEIVSIFLDEAREVLGRCDSLLNTWRDNLQAVPLVQSLQREIHTLKGGARMAGLETLGALSHAMEDLLERTAAHKIPPTESSVLALEQGCDRLNLWVEQIARGQVPDAGNALELFQQQVKGIEGEDVVMPDMEAIQAPAEPKVVTELPEVDAKALSGAEDTTQQQIKVDAELLDELIKSAGEINIFRARLERQVANLRGNLGEFTETISRLREQFRKLEMETEAQIRSRYHEVDSDDESFDPLEMDRFSSMQQLSRGLSESVTDLLNLDELLEESARQADTLLNQQSRVSTELQEGLMHTRMVPFGSIAPRLRRLIRTATSETGKKARLNLRMAGSSDQLDRNVLEHITAPLEHMLRNAIVHGLEDPKTRKAVGKPVTGQIDITVESEATEFVIEVEDDGAGINREAIRKAAFERGLIEEDADPPPAQLFELILASGFTTSETVTGLAGRGVGMDVVRSEVNQIGGSLEIRSEEGQGTCFTIRIPFTLAVMQAIGVTAGEQRYFIPLASVAGVARVPPDEYRALLDQDQPAYRFADEDYPILELEPLLGEPARPLSNDNISLLMIRAGDQCSAFRVPELLGHREVVIKPVGPQITSVPGILGGTVTGDGRVVLVLDPGPIIRQATMLGIRPVVTERQTETRSLRKVAMVVDDSITMRKVNSRVLESQGIEAITAKDGQDAVEQLQNRIPDIMLLDIEMPRMDGFQLAEFIRGDARLRDIPIIMITSRSGQKHRDRAMQAGANAYLTKPYREPELIQTVSRLLSRKEPSASE